jgi:hypothetical protein
MKEHMTLLLGALILSTSIGGSVQSEETKSADWREDYAYTLGVQAYIFSYPWAFLPNIRYAWVVGNKDICPLHGVHHE